MALKKIIYLLIFGCAASLLLFGLFARCGEQGQLSSRGAWVSRFGGFPCRRAGALGRMGSVVVVPGLKRSATPA